MRVTYHSHLTLFSAPPVTSPPPLSLSVSCPNILLSTLFTNSHNLYLWDKISYPVKTGGKSIDFCVLTISYASRRAGRYITLKWIVASISQTFRPLMFSRMCFYLLISFPSVWTMPVSIKIISYLHVMILPKTVMTEHVCSLSLRFACWLVCETFLLRYQIKHSDGNCSSSQADAATATFLCPDDTNHLQPEKHSGWKLNLTTYEECSEWWVLPQGTASWNIFQVLEFLC
jgi:hypothetical protein